jgi:hypothetical protein
MQLTQNLAGTASRAVQVIVRNNLTKSLITTIAVNVAKKLNLKHGK